MCFCRNREWIESAQDENSLGREHAEKAQREARSYQEQMMEANAVTQEFRQRFAEVEAELQTEQLNSEQASIAAERRIEVARQELDAELHTRERELETWKQKHRMAVEDLGLQKQEVEKEHKQQMDMRAAVSQVKYRWTAAM